MRQVLGRQQVGRDLWNVKQLIIQPVGVMLLRSWSGASRHGAEITKRSRKSDMRRIGGCWFTRGVYQQTFADGAGGAVGKPGGINNKVERTSGAFRESRGSVGKVFRERTGRAIPTALLARLGETAYLRRSAAGSEERRIQFGAAISHVLSTWLTGTSLLKLAAEKINDTERGVIHCR